MPGTAHSGRRGDTTQNHILKGTFRGDRHGDHTNPEPPKGKPDSPLELDGLALDEWNRMVLRLERCGTLSLVDDAALYQAAQLFAETEAHAIARMECAETVKILEENLRGLEGPDLVAAFQEITKMRKLELSHATATRSGRMGIRQWLVEFGLTPAARSRIKAPSNKPQSKVESFRNQKQT